MYARAASNFEQLKQAAPLVVEDAPRLYVYRLRLGAIPRLVLPAVFRRGLRHDVIRKHEHTRRDKEDDRTRHLLALRAQTGPVFPTDRSMPAVDSLLMSRRSAPLYDFTAPDGVQQPSGWWIRPKSISSSSRSMPSLRSTLPMAITARPALRVRGSTWLARQGNSGEWDWFLAVAFPDVQLQILPDNRVVKDLAGLTPDAFMNAL